MVILMPIAFPVVVGVAAYLGLVKVGLIGTKSGVALAHSIGSIAYVVVIVSATLAHFEWRLEQAAMSLRAGLLQTFTRVIVAAHSAGDRRRRLPRIHPLLRQWALALDPATEDVGEHGHELDPTIAALLLPVLWLIVLYFGWWRSRPTAQLVLPKRATT